MKRENKIINNVLLCDITIIRLLCFTFRLCMGYLWLMKGPPPWLNFLKNYDILNYLIYINEKIIYSFYLFFYLLNRFRTIWTNYWIDGAGRLFKNQTVNTLFILGKMGQNAYHLHPSIQHPLFLFCKMGHCPWASPLFASPFISCMGSL